MVDDHDGAVERQVDDGAGGGQTTAGGGAGPRVASLRRLLSGAVSLCIHLHDLQQGLPEEGGPGASVAGQQHEVGRHGLIRPWQPERGERQQAG